MSRLWALAWCAGVCARRQSPVPNATKDFEYNLVVVGDVHDDLDAVERLRDHLQRHSRRYDLLLCTGDLTSMAHSGVDSGAAATGDVLRNNGYMRRASTVAEALSSLAPLVYFVPGALDPLPLYEVVVPTKRGGAPAPSTSRNAHGVLEVVTRGLWVAGFGGSPAPFEYKEGSKKRLRVNATASPDRAPAWVAFPYDDAEFKRRQAPWRKALLKVPKGDAVLLLTHAGPDGSGTALVTGNDADGVGAPAGVRSRPLHAGSLALHDLLASPKLQDTARGPAPPPLLRVGSSREPPRAGLAPRARPRAQRERRREVRQGLRAQPGLAPLHPHLRHGDARRDAKLRRRHRHFDVARRPRGDPRRRRRVERRVAGAERALPVLRQGPPRPPRLLDRLLDRLPRLRPPPRGLGPRRRGPQAELATTQQRGVGPRRRRRRRREQPLHGAPLRKRRA